MEERGAQHPCKYEGAASGSSPKLQWKDPVDCLEIFCYGLIEFVENHNSCVIHPALFTNLHPMKHILMCVVPAELLSPEFTVNSADIPFFMKF